jgi:hypothetical protein
MTSRINQQTENTLVTAITELEATVNELKAGVQYTEAKMYEYSSGNSYDMTGTFPTSSIGNQVAAQLLVTATSVDSKSFLSTFFPLIWIPNMAGPYYHDTTTSTFGFVYDKIVTDNSSVTQYWVNIVARPTGTPGSTFYFKAYIYASAPVTVTFQRLI